MQLTSSRPLFAIVTILLFTYSQFAPSQEANLGIKTELKESINKLSKSWYPRSVDTKKGGFYSNFNYKWKKEKNQNKMIVTQTRHVWTTSVLAMHYDDDKYKEIAKHGFDFLKEKMWDNTYGGFNTFASFDGDTFVPSSGYKSAYGNSFGIYALATYFKVSQDTSALNLAKKTFLWLEKNSYDSEFGGYFDVLQPDGSWTYLSDYQNSTPNYAQSKWKDQNSSIHLLESFSALYEVWPDALLRERLAQLLINISENIFTEKGYLSLYLERDWTPVSYRDSTDKVREQNIWFDHVSFGHDVETAFLMLEAAHVLDINNEKILTLAKKIVDHAITNGWDKQNGGFYDFGYYFNDNSCEIIREDKVWWTQAEGLNTLLLMSQLFPEELKYKELFEKQWKYINTHFVDQKNGGWYADGTDVNPSIKKARKGSPWKINYHNIRSLINCTNMLDGTFALTNSSKQH